MLFQKIKVPVLFSQFQPLKPPYYDLHLDDPAQPQEPHYNSDQHPELVQTYELQCQVLMQK